jgi:hypothetical protein
LPDTLARMRIAARADEKRSYSSILRRMSTFREPRPRDHIDAVRDIARDLADIASQISSLKGEAMNWLGDPSYGTLRPRLENAHAAVEARRKVRPNQ